MTTKNDPLPDSGGTPRTELEAAQVKLEAAVQTWQANQNDIEEHMRRLVSTGVLPDLAPSTLAEWGARTGLTPADVDDIAKICRNVALRRSVLTQPGRAPPRP